MAAGEGDGVRRGGLWRVRGEWKLGTKITSHFQGKIHSFLTADIGIHLLEDPEGWGGGMGNEKGRSLITSPTLEEATL